MNSPFQLGLGSCCFVVCLVFITVAFSNAACALPGSVRFVQRQKVEF